MDATTTTIFANVGLSASTLTAFLSNLFSQSLSFLIYTFETLWPFWLVIGLISLIVGVGFAIMHLRH